MPWKNGKMVANTTASPQARSVTAGPNGSFPVGTAKNARLAVSGAARSYNAGNISKATEKTIQSKARAQLGKFNGGSATATGRK